jgi:hypothetical protein
MSALEQLIRDLRDVEADLRDQPDLARRIHDITSRLIGDDVLWIDVARAKFLLGVQWEKTVETWANLGLLRSRHEDDGTLKVKLEDVLRQRQVYYDLAGDWDDREMTPEEYAIRGAVDESEMTPEERELLARARAMSPTFEASVGAHPSAQAEREASLPTP